MRVSVVINTYNRGPSLSRTLESLQWQSCDAFEVIVVNGPSTDCTVEVLEEFRDCVRIYDCPVAHLSKSRNIGIAHAVGEVVAFLDDDAIPDSHWIENLLAGYDEPDVGGVGGNVYDHTGYDFQYTTSVCDRLGNAQFNLPLPLTAYQFAGANPFVYLQGTNCSFKREALRAIGGFDEEIEYYLDETEVCLRITDLSLWIRYLPGAVVHHKFLASHLRNEKRALKHPYPVMKNKTYFALTAGNREPMATVLEDCLEHSRRLVGDATWYRENGLLTAVEYDRFVSEVDRGLRDGVIRGVSEGRKSVDIPEPVHQDFKPFPVLRPEGGRLNLCYLSQDYPPGNYGGIARLTSDLAREIASQGHEVHVVTRSQDRNRVDFEHGVWVHRIVADSDGPWKTVDMPQDLTKLLGYASAAHREVRRMHDFRHFDIVTVPSWDSEGLFCLQDQSLTTMLSLVTSLKTVVGMNPSWRSNPAIGSMMALEQDCLRAAKYIYSISRANLAKALSDFGPPSSEMSSWIVPPGTEDVSHRYSAAPRNDDRIRVLFVGRLEKRKGIDLLFEAANRLLREFPQVEFRLVGDDSIPTETGETYRNRFERKWSGDPVASRVIFRGKLDEEELYREYAECDIFCLPARYESFGLVLVEAMQFGKPVIAAACGGMVEVVRDNSNGLLFHPEDVGSLTSSLRRLLGDAGSRIRLGRQARTDFENEFSRTQMAARSLEVYRDVRNRRSMADIISHPAFQVESSLRGRNRQVA